MQEVSTIRTPDDQTLFVRCVASRTRSDRCVLLVHGFGEHGGRYSHVSRLLSQHGWNVVLPDHRGHGLSSGTPTHTRDFRQFVADLELVRQLYCPDPDRTVIFGHSMGGLVAIRHAQLFADRCAAMVLTSPLLRLAVPIPLWTWFAGRILSVVSPSFRFKSRVKPEDATRCEKRRSINDPLVHRSITAGCFFAMRRGLDAAWDDAEAFTVPLLVMQAGQDRVVDPTAVHPWLHRIRSDDATFRLYSGHLHELLNEPDWRDVVQTVLQWLDRRIPIKSDRARVLPLPTADPALRRAA